MNIEREVKLQLFIDSLKINGTQKRRYIEEGDGFVNSELTVKMKQAFLLKREAKYDESFDIYFEIIDECGDVIGVDICRGLSKTLCAMNEYDAALSLLLMCMALTLEGSIIGQTDPCLLNDSSMDCAFIAMGIKKASEGRPELIMQRTIDVSGNMNYHFVLSPQEIVERAKVIMEGTENKYMIPENAIDDFLKWPVIQAFFEEEYTYAKYL